jgi:hypothetical protein
MNDLSGYVVGDDSADEDITGGAMASGRSTTMIVIAILVVLTILVGFLMWRRRWHSKPDCSKYSGDTASMCSEVTAACADDGACLNAAAHCLPIAASLAAAPTPAAAAATLAGFKPRELTACTNAVAAVDPKRVAKVTGACLPPDMALAASAMTPDEAAAAYNVAANRVDAGRPLAPWGVRVAQAMPACPPGPASIHRN